MQMLVVSPFITIILSFLLFEGLMPKTDTNPNVQQFLAYFSSTMFAFFVLLSFSLCSGLYILSPVTDRQNKLRHLLNFIGLKPLAYYIGSYLADIILFIIPTLGFMILLYPLGVKYFFMNFAWAKLIVVFGTFGLSMIALTYLLSFMFANPNTAFKNIGVLYLIVGTMVPNFIGLLLAGVS